MENNLRYLLLGRVLPEIGMFATDGQRKTALRHALSVTSHGSSRLWAWTLLYVLAVVGTIYVGFYLETRSPVASEIASKLMPLALAATCLWFCRSVLRKRLRILLAARGVPICIPCGYDLRGQVAARCPECGSTFDEGLLSSSDIASGEIGQREMSIRDWGKVRWYILLIIIALVAGYYLGGQSIFTALAAGCFLGHWLLGDR